MIQKLSPNFIFCSKSKQLLQNVFTIGAPLAPKIDTKLAIQYRLSSPGKYKLNSHSTRKVPIRSEVCDI